MLPHNMIIGDREREGRMNDCEDVVRDNHLYSSGANGRRRDTF
jgi:hypothetical protein